MRINLLKITVVLSCIVIFTLSLEKIKSLDIFWHLKLGEYALENKHVLKQDIYSHTHTNKPVANHAPAFQILVTKIHKLAGFNGLVLLKAILNTLLFVLGLLLIKRFNLLAVWQVLLFTSLFLAVKFLLTLHPQSFFFIFLLSIFCLTPIKNDNFQNKSRKSEILKAITALFILILWPFFHPSFFAGLLLLFLIPLNIIVKPRKYLLKNILLWTSVPMLAAGVIFLMEPGFYYNVFEHGASGVMLKNIHYWQPFWSDFSFDFNSVFVITHLFLISIATITFISLKSTWKKFTPHILLFLLTIIISAIASTRFLPLIVLIPASMIIGVLASKESFLGIKFCNTVSTFYLIFALLFSTMMGIYLPGFGYDKKNVPSGCIDYLKKNSFKKNIYNSYNYGGILIYTFGANKKVFIDPRSSQLYPDSFLSKFIEAYKNPLVFEKLVSRYNVDHTMLKKSSGMTKKLIHYLEKSPKWKLRYMDNECIIHEKQTD